MDAERCVCCGKIIPEGSMVCYKCNKEHETTTPNRLFNVALNTVTDINDFVSLCSKCTDDVSVYSGRWIISGKSLMGMFSLNLDKPFQVEFHGLIPDEVIEGINKYIVER